LRLIPEKNLFSPRKTMFTDPETQTNLEKLPGNFAVQRLPSGNNKIKKPVCNLKAGI